MHLRAITLQARYYELCFTGEETKARRERLSEMVSVELVFKPSVSKLLSYAWYPEKSNNLPQVTQPLRAELGLEASSQRLPMPKAALWQWCVWASHGRVSTGDMYRCVWVSHGHVSTGDTCCLSLHSWILFQKWPLLQAASLPALHGPPYLTLFPWLCSYTPESPATEPDHSQNSPEFRAWVVQPFLSNN